jgi:Glyoxalase-like domain
MVAIWRKALVDRLLALGARRYPWKYRPGADFVALEDPDGNLFCVVEKAETARAVSGLVPTAMDASHQA